MSARTALLVLYATQTGALSASRYDTLNLRKVLQLKWLLVSPVKVNVCALQLTSAQLMNTILYV
jgi:hypothetical protein